MLNTFFTIENEHHGALVSYSAPPLDEFKAKFVNFSRIGAAWRFPSLSQIIDITRLIQVYQPTLMEGLSICNNRGEKVWSYPDSLLDIVEEDVMETGEQEAKGMWCVIERDGHEHTSDTVRHEVFIGFESKEEAEAWSKDRSQSWPGRSCFVVAMKLRRS